MIQSMTGFGSASFTIESNVFEIEVRSVNHRHLDARVRLPRGLTGLDADFRAHIQARFERGRFDCTVTASQNAGPTSRLEIDSDAARQYVQAARELAREEGVSGDFGVADLLALPGVARLVEVDLEFEVLQRSALSALDAALDALDAMRAAEGEALARDLSGRITRVADLADSLEGRAGLVQEAVRKRLHKRTQQLELETGLLDEARLHQEITIAADRLDITEEIVRLRSHTDQFRKLLEAGGVGHPVGRRLDFLLQEFGREANTVGSKGADASTAHLVVELKTELERLREQVQNVE